jgi:hypothetical protein
MGKILLALLFAMGKVLPMPATTHTAAEQRFWDAAFLLAYPECLKALTEKGAEYCAHLAREQADAAIAERRRAQGRVK